MVNFASGRQVPRLHSILSCILLRRCFSSRIVRLVVALVPVKSSFEKEEKGKEKKKLMLHAP